VTHKPVISKEDMIKLKNTPALSRITSSTLLNAVWFLCHQLLVPERQRRITTANASFAFAYDAKREKCANMTHEEASKNHPGGEKSKPYRERQTRLFGTYD